MGRLSDEQLKSIVEDILDRETYMKKQEDGYFVCKIYADYRDELSDKAIKTIVQAKEPMETFYDMFSWFDTESEETFELLKTVEKHWDDSNGSYEDYRNDVLEIINEIVLFEFPYDHYLNQDVNVNVLVNCGDGNYVYTLNNFASYNAVKNEVINNESSILWLLKQQGYSKRQLNNVVRKEEFYDSIFLKSVYEECINVSTHMNALAFFVRMTLKEYLEYLQSPTDIQLSKDSVCGLYDCWNGAGGPLSINLEKPVVIPQKYIQMHIDGCRGHGIASIYGVSNSFWKDTITVLPKRKSAA